MAKTRAQGRSGDGRTGAGGDAGPGSSEPEADAVERAAPRATNKRRSTKKKKASARRRGSDSQDDSGAQVDADADDEPAEPVEPEVLLDADADPDVDDEGEGEGEAESEVLDLGGSLPTAPAASLPARRASALDQFLAEVGRYPVLSPEEERQLTLDYWERQDPSAARRLVVHNLRLVVKMAYKYRRAWANVLDLIQEGNVGLVEAVRRFDPFKGAKFSTYATFWIRAYMLRYLLEHSRMVRLSRTRVGRKLFFQLSKERAKLQAQGIDPGPKLLAERLGVDQGELEDVVRHMDQAEVRLDAPLGDEGGGGTVLDALATESASPEAEAYRREISSDISKALDAFAATLTDPREKEAWEQHLMSEDPTSLSELGQKFGVTKQRMGQIVAGLRKRLREHLIASLGPDVELGFQLEGE